MFKLISKSNDEFLYMINRVYGPQSLSNILTKAQINMILKNPELRAKISQIKNNSQFYNQVKAEIKSKGFLFDFTDFLSEK